MTTYDYNWTDEEDRLLTSLYAQNLTFFMIAKELKGRTRNSCVGRARRLGLVRVKPEKQKKEDKRSFNKFVQKVPHLVDPHEWKYKGNIGIMDLKEDTCRFPSNEKPVTYCGSKVEYKSYCMHHAKLAYVMKEK